MLDTPVQFLIVDDLEPNLLVLESLLKREGLSFLRASSGPEALELLLKEDVALALIDIQMPNMDGFDLAEAMRGTERTRRIPIIFITAGAQDNQQRFRGYDLGAVDYLYKPVDPHILRSKAHVFFELAQQRKELQSVVKERTEAERRARESNLHTRGVLNNLFAFVGLLDTEGVLLDVNRAPLEAAGIDSSQVIGRTFWDAYWWSHSAESQAQLKQAFERAKQGEVVRYDTVVRMANDSRMWIDFQIAPLRNEAGEIVNIIPSAMDITRRRGAQEELQRKESQLRTILDNLPVGIVYANEAGDILFGNPAANRIWGATKRVGLSEYGVYKGWWHDSGKPVLAHEWSLARAISNGETVLNDLVDIETFDGMRKTVTNSAVPIPGVNGAGQGAVCIMQDVTDRLGALRALQESETRFRQLADSMPQLVWTAGPEGRVDYYNAKVTQYPGARQSPNGEWEWDAIVHPEDLKRTKDAWDNALRTGSHYEIEHRVKTTPETFRWHLSRAYPSRDETGVIVKWFGTATDIDDQKRAQEILEKAVAERTAKLRESVTELEAFSYSIAHDLRAPLRSMHGFSQLLISDYASQLNEEALGFLTRISTAATRMDSLVMDILEYSRVVRGEASIEPVELALVLRDVIESNPALRERASAIQIAESLPLVLGNRAMLTQVFSNLLANAVKFVKPQTEPSVQVWSEPGTDTVRVYVRDNGIGIAPEQHNRIFGIFQRIHRSYDGTGIGLAIVQKAVQRLGGDVGVESTTDKGSTFWVELRTPPQSQKGV